MEKVAHSIDARISADEASSRAQIVAGLPVSIAITYAVIFTIGLCFYSWLWDSAPIIVPDSPSYVRAAQDLADFRVDELNSRPPGYPLLLVLTGYVNGATRPLFYTSLAFHFVSIWLMAALLNRMGLRCVWLIVFAGVLMLPPYIEYAAYVLSDNLSTVLLVTTFAALGFWLLRGRGTSLVILSGIAMGFSALTRPTYQILAFISVAYLLMARWVVGEKSSGSYRSYIRAGAILLTASVVLIGGYSLVNYVKFGFFGIYPMAGFNLSTRTVRFLERLPDEYAAEREALIKARDAHVTKRGEDHTPYLSYWKAVPELQKITGLKPIPDLAQHLMRLNLLLIKKAPLNFLQEIFVSFSSYWLPSATELANMHSFALQALWVLLHFGILGTFVLVATVICGLTIFHLSSRLILGFDSRINFAGFQAPFLIYFFAGIIVFYNAIATCMVEVGDPRYRVPTEPLIIFMCFLGFYLWGRLLVRNPLAIASERALGPAS